MDLYTEQKKNCSSYHNHSKIGGLCALREHSENLIQLIIGYAKSLEAGMSNLKATNVLVPMDITVMPLV